MSGLLEIASARSPHPATTVKAAIEWARDKGLRIRLVESFGVVCISTHAPTWEVDPRAEGVSPVGAVVLMEQPPCSDTDEAASLALDAPPAYCDGLAAGIAKAEPSKAWVESTARRLYLAGWEAGLFVRSWLMRGGAVAR
jgi:hypothetical protein